MDPQPRRRRRRPALSCVECRRRKIKCDRNNPCSHCVSTKARCTYRVYNDGPALGPYTEQLHSLNETPSPTAPSSSPTLAPDRRVEDSGRPIRNNNSYSSTAPTVVSTALPVIPTPATGTASTETQDDGTLVVDRTGIQPLTRKPNVQSDLQDILQRLRKLEESSSSGPDPSRDILSLHYGPVQDSQIVLNKTRVLRWSFWTGMSQEVCPYLLPRFFPFRIGLLLIMPRKAAAYCKLLC